MSWGDDNSEAVSVPANGAVFAQHTYAVVGPATVTLTLNVGAAIVTQQQQVTVTNQPSLSLEVEVDRRTVTANVGVLDDDGTLAQLLVDWDDGSAADVVQSGSANRHDYEAPGTYAVTLSALDSEGVVSLSVQRSVTVQNAVPEVGVLLPSVEGVQVLLPLNPNDDGTVTTVHIDWGDGPIEDLQFEAGLVAQHDYAVPGRQTIRVSVTDDDGSTSGASVVSPTTGVPSDEVLRIGFDGNTASQVGPSLSTNNAPAFVGDRFGDANKAADFHKTNQAGQAPLLSTADAAVAVGTSATFSVWLKRRSQTPLVDRIIGVGTWFALFVDDDDPTAVRFGRTDGIRTAAEGAVRDAFIPVEADGWQHYVGTVAQVTPAQFRLRLFRNGVLRAEQVINAPLPTRPACRVYVGGFPSGNLCSSTTVDDSRNNPPLDVDDVRVYNRTLRDVEVAALFHESGFAP